MDQRDGSLKAASDQPPLEKATDGQEDGHQSSDMNSNRNDKTNNEYPSTWKLILITIALCFAVLCFGLDNTILATAIPRITDHFHALNDVGWYGSSYLLTSCSFQLLFGKIYARYSVKLVFLVAVAIFELGSVLCGAAPNSTTLIVGRAVSGIGSAGIFSGAMLIIANSVPLHRRPVYAGMISSMFGVANVAGPLLGGVFTDSHLTWRWCFYINLPFGAVTILFVLIALPWAAPKRNENWKTQISQLDIEGTICFLPAVISLLLALQWGGSTYPWSEGRVIGLLVVFGVLLVAFAIIQYWKGENGTVPPRILLNRNILGCSEFGFCFGASFFILQYYIPIWFQAIKGVSAMKSGIMNLPILLSLVVSSMIGGGLTTLFGYYTYLIYISTILMSVGAGMLTTFEIHTGSAKWVGYQVIYGLGVGLGMQLPIIAIQATLPKEDIAIGTAIFIFIEQFGGAIFISVAQNVFTTQLLKNLSNIPGFDPRLILKLGATQIQDNVPAKYLDLVLVAYNKSLVHTWYAAVALSAVSVVGALAIEWKSVKAQKVKEEIAVDGQP